MAVHLVCEGVRGGLDERVLNLLVVQPHGLGVLAAPAGGGGSLRAVRAHLEARSPRDVAVSVGDRDYDRTRAEADASWADPAGRRYFWRRHEVENYLLEPAVVLALFNALRATQPWAATLPATQADVTTLLQRIAAQLLENHAAEVLWRELRGHLNALEFAVTTPDSHPSRAAPGRAEWEPALHNRAAATRAACTVGMAHPALLPGAVTDRYAAVLAGLQDPVFLAAEGFLAEMGGKELMTALAIHLRTVGAPAGLNDEVLTDDLLDVLVPMYRPGETFQPDDFAELAVILARHLPTTRPA